MYLNNKKLSKKRTVKSICKLCVSKYLLIHIHFKLLNTLGRRDSEAFYQSEIDPMLSSTYSTTKYVHCCNADTDEDIHQR